MIDEFWKTRSHNLVDAFDPERAALMASHDAIQVEGESLVEHLYLVEDDSDGDASRVIGMGRALLDRINELR